MDISNIWEELAQDGQRIVYLVLDGGADLRQAPAGRTALQAARTPNLDRLAEAGSCGLLELVGPGITPGSGPGHLALFGYDPLRHRIGRGVLSALGIDFPLQPGDVAARLNFATLDDDGQITDRRAGRIDTGVNTELCGQLRDRVDLPIDGEVFLETVSEHRAVLVLRGEVDGAPVSDALADTDPQRTGVAPLPAKALEPAAEATARAVDAFSAQVRDILAGRDQANALLLRGFQRYEPPASLEARFGLRGLCLARYPMYRGLSRLLGMDVVDPPAPDFAGEIAALRERYDDGHGFYFLHVKGSDKAGEDGNFDAKVEVLEAVDRDLPALLDMQPDVLAVTSDHTTPALMAAHSWHPVPVALHSPYVRRDAVDRFDELACAGGVLGLRPGVHLMGLALANAGRLRKYGA